VNYEQFKEILGNYLKKMGFKYKKSCFYFLSEETIIVIGIQKSQWGEEYYIRYGFSLRALHKENEYPKVHESDICGGFYTGMLNPTAYTLDGLNESDLLCSIEDNYIERVDLVLKGGIMEYFRKYPQSIPVSRKKLREYFNLN